LPAFNDWAADHCSHEPRRLHGVGLVALDDIGVATTELTRIAAMGLPGAMIGAEEREGRPYGTVTSTPSSAPPPTST
jgi:hypothetical protein